MLKFRITILLFGSFLLATGLMARLFLIAVGEHSFYLARANAQQNVVRNVFPRRGDLLVQDYALGKTVPIAKSQELYALSATPKNVTKKEQYAHVLAQFTKGDEASLLTTFKQDGLYMNPLEHSLTKAQVESLASQLNLIELASNKSYKAIPVNFDQTQGDIIYLSGGVFFIREFQRVYPEGSMLGQVLGFVDNQGKGRYGVEQNYDQQLRGYSGQVSLERDSVGTLLTQKNTIEGKDGTNYELSIDRNIQYIVEQDLAAEIKDSEAEGGTVIIMNPKNGEIVAMASAPSYDPANFRDVTQDKIGEFDNPAISHVWEPGSIFKPLVMAAALDLGLVTADTKGHYGESVTVDGHVIETALRKDYGEETMTDVLKNSDNVAMVSVAEKIGNQRLYDYLGKYGFGTATNVDLANEIAGTVLPVKQWRNINRATIAFGQGIAVTPMQIISAYSAVARNGTLVQPHIVHAIIHPDGSREEVQPVVGVQVIKPETVQTLRTMMVATVLFAHNRAGKEGYKIAGKTGTAQIPDSEKGGYIADAYNHSFIGIGPSDDPKYVMLIKIDHPNLKKVGLYAEGTAVPLFGQISNYLLDYYQIPPTNK